jgi:hypothetical protein
VTGRFQSRSSPGSRQGYALRVGSSDDQVLELRRLLEHELDSRLGPHLGCWPLLVAVLGVLVGVLLLAEKL